MNRRESETVILITMSLKQSPLLLLFSAFVLAAAAALPEPGSNIKEIDLVHFSHTDVGFTDSPSVCRELYRRYLDVALDTILDSMKGPAGKRFYWTAESTLAVNDWWQAATPARRQLFLKAVHGGQLEVTALACNNTPFMNAAQWQTMVHWLPEDVWRQVHPTVAIQDDVLYLGQDQITVDIDGITPTRAAGPVGNVLRD